MEYQNKQQIERWLQGGKIPGPRTIKNYLIKIFGEICSDCGLDEALRAYSKKPALKVESWNFMSKS